MTLRPDDGAGEGPLGLGYFTYALRIQNGRLYLRAENDERTSTIVWFLAHHPLWRGEMAFEGVIDRSAFMRFRSDAQGVRAIIEYVSGVPPVRWQEECSISVGLDDEIEFRGISYRQLEGAPGTFNLDTIRARLDTAQGTVSGTVRDDAGGTGTMRFIAPKG